MKTINEKVFELYWSWYEEYTPYLFYHENKTKDEFESDVKQLLRLGTDAITDKNKGMYIGAKECIDFISDKIEQLGYQRIEPIAWGFFGGSILDGSDGESRAWSDLIGEEQMEKIISHNRNITTETLPF